MNIKKKWEREQKHGKNIGKQKEKTKDENKEKTTKRLIFEKTFFFDQAIKIFWINNLMKIKKERRENRNEEAREEEKMYEEVVVGNELFYN